MNMTKAQVHQSIANLLALLERHLPNEYLVCDSGSTIELNGFAYFAIRRNEEFLEFTKLGGSYSVISNENWTNHLSSSSGISFADMQLILEN